MCVLIFSVGTNITSLRNFTMQLNMYRYLTYIPESTLKLPPQENSWKLTLVRIRNQLPKKCGSGHASVTLTGTVHRIVKKKIIPLLTAWAPVHFLDFLFNPYSNLQRYQTVLDITHYTSVVFLYSRLNFVFFCM
jgi:hypothetical protein